jgi:hypothetical protein
MYNNGNVFIYISVYFEADVVERHSWECVSFAENDIADECIIQDVVSLHMCICISLS